MKVFEGKVSDLIPDDQNANMGTQYGDHLLDKSLRTSGAGRSVLVDKNGRLIAGNKTTEKAFEVGIEDTIVVQSDGTKLVVVQRTDIDLDSPEGRMLALADNKVGEVNLEFDPDVIKSLGEEHNLDLAELGFKFEFEDTTPNEYPEKELTDKIPTTHTCPNCKYEF